MLSLLWSLSALAQPSPDPATEPPPEPVPAEEPAAVRTDEPDRLAALEASLEAAVEATAAELAAQQAALMALQQQLTQTKLALIPKDKFTVDMEGHYRVRGHVYNHLFLSQGEGDAYRDARYMSQRLWLRPKFDYRGLAKLIVEARALENVVFGDNASIASTSLFAVDPSMTGVDGREVIPVTIGRVWTEFKIPVGEIRVGRMPSEWGMRLLVSQGDGFDQPFGEANYPSTNDRVMFATKPLSIVDAITGRDDRGIPFVVAVAVDRLVEDPLYQYYGYTCDPGDARGGGDYDPRCDSDGDGVTDLDHSYQDDGRTAESRGNDWWADQNDDVMQMVYVAIYRGENIRYFGGQGDLTAGVWAVNRSQRETDSKVWIVDGWLKAFVHRMMFEAEVVSISGPTRALPLPDPTLPDPIGKQANILGYAAKGGFVFDPIVAMVETGFASGDENVLDQGFTGRSLHPDHNVGLLLYDVVLANVTAAVRTSAARGLWSNGGVYSSRYVFPTLTFSPLDNWSFIGGAVGVWPHKPDGATLRCKSSDKVDCDTPVASQATANAIGWELDFAVKYSWHQHMKWSLESGYAKVTDRVPLERAGLNPDGKFFTVQSRIAWEF